MELIYTVAKLVIDIIDIPLRNPRRNAKPGREIRQKGHLKKHSQQAKVLKRKYTQVHWNGKKETKTVTNKSDNTTGRNKKKKNSGQKGTQMIPGWK